MGWFDEQIKQRMKNDNDAFSAAFAHMSGAVTGEKMLDGDFCDNTQRAKDAISDILKYYHVPVQELPVNVKDINDVTEYLLRPSGIMRSTITLSGEWYKDGIGALLCTTEDGSITALIPKGSSGYTFFDKSLGKTVAVNKKNAAIFQAEAMCFYKPFPLKQLTAKDLLQYILGTLSLSDYIAVALATLAVALIGLFTAYANNVIFTNVVYSDAPSLLLSAGVLLLGVTLSSVAIRITKRVLLSRVSTKMKVPVESATMMRILFFPAFRKSNFPAAKNEYLPNGLRHTVRCWNTLTILRKSSPSTAQFLPLFPPLVLLLYLSGNF